MPRTRTVAELVAEMLANSKEGQLYAVTWAEARALLHQITNMPDAFPAHPTLLTRQLLVMDLPPGQGI